MLKDLKRTCGSLTDEELSQVTNYLWPSNGIITSIYYTFDQNVIPSFMEDFFNKTFPNTSFFKTSVMVKNAINLVLDKWVNACDRKVEFKYIETPVKGFSGIIFQSCQFDKRFKVAGASNGFFDKGQNVRGKPRSLLNVICIPETIGMHDIHLFSHEIGHALGLMHFHDVYRLKNHLISTHQGLGCSVMPYPNLVQAEKMSNVCNTNEICADEGYAIFPGPLDALACSSIYDLNKNFENTALPTHKLNIESGDLSLSLHQSLLNNFTLPISANRQQDRGGAERHIFNNASLSLALFISLFLLSLLKNSIKPRQIIDDNARLKLR